MSLKISLKILNYRAFFIPLEHKVLNIKYFRVFDLQVKEQMKQVELPPKFQNRDNFIKAHCKAVAELIDQVVENLDHLDNVTGELMRIGRVHAKVLRGELTGKLWNTVAETIIDCTLEWGDRRFVCFFFCMI